MKKFICLTLVCALFLTSCASVDQYQSKRGTAYKEAQKELKQIDLGCQKKNGITKNDLAQIDNPLKRLSEKQYKYQLCYLGAKYIAFEKYVEDKVSWKKNLQSNTRTTRSLYRGQISKNRASELIRKSNAEFQSKESDAVVKVINGLRLKDKTESDAAIAGLVLAAVVVAAIAVASGGGAGGGNSYSGYSSYSGNCPCPYSIDASGKRCGARSAYSRSGGASPQCY